MQTTTCPIWGTPAQEFPKTGDRRDLHSPRVGGYYSIAGDAVAGDLKVLWSEFNDEQKERLTKWINSGHRAGTKSPLITSIVLTSVTG